MGKTTQTYAERAKRGRAVMCWLSKEDGERLDRLRDRWGYTGTRDVLAEALRIADTTPASVKR